MTRSLKFWLAAAVVVLVGINLVWSWWADRGLITIHVDEQPLGKVVDSIARQGGVKLATNLDRSTPVTLHFDKVPLTDALERLTGVVDARWSLAYLFAPSQPAIREALAEFSAGRLPEAWRTYRMPVQDLIVDEDYVPPDPRSLKILPESPAEQKLQAYLTSFAESANAMAAAPTDWNPDVTKSLKEEVTPKVAKAIASSAKGEMLETFLLMGFGNRSDGPPPAEQVAENGEQPRRRMGGGNGGGRPRMNFEAMAKRTEKMIAQLPPEQKAIAQAEFQAERSFWEEVRALPEDQRRAKMEERMADPAVQERMARRQEYRDARSSPAKRFERYKRYVDRKQRAQAGN